MNCMLLRPMAITGLFLACTCAEAGFVNGGFENGYLGFATLGAASTESSSIGVDPTQGHSQAFLQSGNVMTTATIEEIDTQFGFLGGQLRSLSTGLPKAGSGFLQVFSIAESSILSFDFNFLTSHRPGSEDPDFNDFAFVSIGTSIENTGYFAGVPVGLADLSSRFVDSSASSFLGETGYRNYSVVLPEAGTYAFGLGVIDVGDQSGNSGLLIDNIRISPVTVPVPASMVPLGIGLAALGGYTWHRRRRTAR
ncbi:hypothetical protein [Paludisphaera sp.]|uniref:hypothetical protein n=1 Tax=Paludisphaera sp. TaxID=2017432 RepID=UPI00301BD1E7